MMDETTKQASGALQEFIADMENLYGDEVLIRKLREMQEALSQLSQRDGETWKTHAVCFTIISANEETGEVQALTARDAISPFSAEVMSEVLGESQEIFVQAGRRGRASQGEEN